MPSDLQQVAQGLVECLDQAPGILQHLQRTAGRCRENAAVLAQLGASTAAQQLDAAARACDEAAHYLSLAPPKAKGWAERLIGAHLDGSRQPDAGSAGRNPLTAAGPKAAEDKRDAGRGDARGRPESAPDRQGDEAEPSDREATPEPGKGGGSGGSGRASLPTNSPDEPEPAPFFGDFLRGLPVRPKEDSPTAGVLTRIDGKGAYPLDSGDGPGRGSPGLSGRNARLMVAQDHVEGHAAALMRRAGAPREATLYINNPPCGLFGKPKRLGCDKTLKYQLPVGSKLTIYWPGGYKVYIGEEGEPEYE
ncbi:DddA-like double-stranded DNA deaminase toxin [Kribbella sp. NPDC056861]|uniref:DddA-like double-stranded DNA deaminase toxin n=1 Tax=Kribbella sp. NPDC056861 TaxID=3154857 RepID=UPI003430BA36